MPGPRKPLLCIALAAAAAAALGGCDTKAEVMPLEEAMYQPPKPIEAPLVRLEPRADQAHRPAERVGADAAGRPEVTPDSGNATGTGRMAGSLTVPTVRVGDQVWQQSATEYTLDRTMLRPVASARGQTLHAMAWDEPPFDRLFAPAAPRGTSASRQTAWREYLEIY